MLSDAVTDATSAGLNGPAERLHIVPTRLVKRTWLGHAKAGKKNKGGDNSDRFRTHDAISTIIPALSLLKFKRRFVGQLKLQWNDITFSSSPRRHAKVS